MDRLNQILKEKKASQPVNSAVIDPLSKRLKNFMIENRIPRLFLFAFIAVKMTTIYDKIR